VDASQAQTLRARLGDACKLAASMSLVGAYVALVKPLTALLPIFALAFLRFAIAAVALLPWTWRGATEPPLTRFESRQLFLQSFFGNFLFSICMLWGVALTSATAAGLVMGALPVVVALLSCALLGERITGRLLLAVLCAGAGIALVQLARPTQLGATSSWLGDALVFGAVCCEALYVVIGKRLSATRTPMRVSAWINLWGLALSAPVGLWQIAQFELSSINGLTWAYLVFYALASSVIAVGLWMSGLRNTPAVFAGVFTVALPLSTAAVAVGVLGEELTGWHALALICALVAILLVAWPASRPGKA
jgi:drug/metabolite transporter (DMT)-like permease